MTKVPRGQERESRDGFDGDVGSPIPTSSHLATEIFDGVLVGGRTRSTAAGTRSLEPRPQLLDFVRVPGGRVNRNGVRLNVSSRAIILTVAVRNGGRRDNNLIEDAATADISLAQLCSGGSAAPRWRTAGGSSLAVSTRRSRDEELAALCGRVAATSLSATRRASRRHRSRDTFTEFLRSRPGLLD